MPQGNAIIEYNLCTSFSWNHSDAEPRTVKKEEVRAARGFDLDIPSSYNRARETYRLHKMYLSEEIKGINTDISRKIYTEQACARTSIV